MFLNKYLNDFYYNEVLDNYTEEYLYSLDEVNFDIIYNLFKEYNFYYIEDIVLKYLEIFELPVDLVYQRINLLKEKLGDNFVYIIGQDMRYLNYILEV